MYTTRDLFEDEVTEVLENMDVTGNGVDDFDDIVYELTELMMSAYGRGKAIGRDDGMNDMVNTKLESMGEF
jgi:hypothetical protein